MKIVKTISLCLSFLFVPVVPHASAICPALTGASSAYYGSDTPASSNCNEIITINPDMSTTIAVVNANPYDGNDDNYVGVVNDYKGSIASIVVSGNGVYGFDGDGIDYFGIPGNSIDVGEYGSGAYGGSDAYYSNIVGSTGDVNFLGNIGVGGTGYFSLENAPSAAAFTVPAVNPSTVPEPGSLLLLGTGVLGMAGAIRRRLNA